MDMTYEVSPELKKLQDKLLVALSAFDRICTDAGCQYSLMCGTLLGAIRHQGFIPWDDDVDVVMFRDEYNKFRNYCMSQNLSDGVYLDEEDTWVPRIRIDQDKKVFVDIFILDNVAPKPYAHRITLLKLKILQGMMKKDIAYGRYTLVNKVRIFITHVLGLPFPFHWKYQKYHKL